MIPVFRWEELTDDAAVWIENSSDAIYCQHREGTEWIRKREQSTGYQPLLAEALGWLLAGRLQVPVPSAGVCLHPDAERSWLSKLVPGVTHWQPAAYIYIHNLEALGRMLTLDWILLNEDRHAGNILLQADPDPLHLRVWTIDVGNAVAGHAADYSAQRNASPSTRNLARDLPVGLLQPGASAAADEARALASTDLRSIVNEACAIAREEGEPRDQLFATLAHRCAVASQELPNYLAALHLRSQS